MTPTEHETELDPAPQPAADDRTPAFPRLAIYETDEAEVAPVSSFEAILDAYGKEPDRWDGLE